MEYLNTCFETTNASRIIATYSHLLPAGIMLMIAIYIIFKNRNIINLSFFIFLFYFIVWLFGDWVTWVTNNYHLVNVWWSLLDYLDVVVFVGAVYFYSVFVNGGEIKTSHKFILTLTTLYPLYATLSGQSIHNFNHPFCESEENSFLIIYRFIIEISSIIAIVILSFKGWHKPESPSRKNLGLVGSSLALFLLTISITGYLSSHTEIYEIQLYGMFVLPVFIILIIIAISRYNLFQLRFRSQQLLGFILIPLVASQLFFLNNSTDFILNIITLIITGVIIYMLNKSIKREGANRQKIESLNIELLKTNDKLRELDQQKSEFISVASHQLRGPLTAIKGYSSLLLEGDFGTLTNEVKGAVETIFKSTQALVVIVGDYLDVSRIEQGRMKYDFVDFDFKQLVQSVTNEFEPNIRISNLALDTRIEDGRDYMVHGDQGKLKQVISNLFDNAIKYTKQGGISVNLNRNDDNIQLSIKDTGIGISTDIMPRLFEKFTRAPGASDTNITGTGLGLYVAKKMVEAHRGKVWVESEGKGKGSTFFVEIEALHKRENRLGSKLNKFEEELQP